MLSTAPDREVAAALAAMLVGERLAACVNLVGGVESIYRWDGEICTDTEVLMVLKTTESRLEALVDALNKAHPYDCPEIVALPVVGGSADYLNWISTSLAGPDNQD